MSQWQIPFPATRRLVFRRSLVSGLRGTRTAAGDRAYATRCMKLRWIEFMPHEAETKWHDLNFECSIVFTALAKAPHYNTFVCLSPLTSVHQRAYCPNMRPPMLTNEGPPRTGVSTACLQVSAEVKRSRQLRRPLICIHLSYHLCTLLIDSVISADNTFHAVKIVKKIKETKHGLHPSVLHVLFFHYYARAAMTTVNFN